MYSITNTANKILLSRDLCYHGDHCLLFTADGLSLLDHHYTFTVNFMRSLLYVNGRFVHKTVH